MTTPMTPLERKALPLPGGHSKVLLHSCCAPCSGEVMEAMLVSGIDYTIFFHSPNIHPRKAAGRAPIQLGVLYYGAPDYEAGEGSI
ncbi:Epoxyqueuosine reductase QueH [Ralstonia flaminis]|jgi:hypothetical protein|uniref:Epoxyqueuosine reductase QueH n=1 Tax=Ralstonia flaminis TaxID=3058597 RepID=A0ABN9JTB6_9RALS|nr:Epoxyqueuosine reductase QueH [Ralstonia sp. LMG 18101]